jgi:hypothetical protein
MNDSVHDEYVHVDWYEQCQIDFPGLDPHETINVVYEPLDNPVERSTLQGKIMVALGVPERVIPFRIGRHHSLVIDSDEVLLGYFYERRIRFTWRERPEQHYLCVSYEFAGRPEQKVAWLREGF